MQLTGPESAALELVGPPYPEEHRPASFDLTIGKVVVGGEEQHDPVLIQPQQTFVIESAQRVKLQKGYVGYAMPKTSLCNDGILVLNTGLVDPGYDGTLSTIAINFSNSAQRIRFNTAFLRIVFHQLTGKDADKLDRHVTAPTVEQLKARSRIFAGSFLDVPGQADKITRAVTGEVLDRQRNGILLLISAVGFLFVMWNLGSYFLVTRQANLIADRTAQAGTHEERIHQLEERLKAQVPSPTPGGAGNDQRVTALEQKTEQLKAQIARLQALVESATRR